MAASTSLGLPTGDSASTTKENRSEDKNSPLPRHTVTTSPLRRDKASRRIGDTMGRPQQNAKPPAHATIQAREYLSGPDTRTDVLDTTKHENEGPNKGISMG